MVSREITIIRVKAYRKLFLPMKRVLHIGAADGEIEFYDMLGIDKLVYAEPDQTCLSILLSNIKNSINKASKMQILVIPKSCSDRSGKK